MRVLLCIVAVLVVAAPVAAQTYITEDLFTSATWALAGSPYVIQADIWMSPGNTLTIEPGVTVIFDGDYRLGIGFNASIVAEGTGAEPILFTSGSGTPFPGSWNWLSVGDQALGIFLRTLRVRVR